MAPNSRSFAPQVFGFPPKTTFKVKTNLWVSHPESRGNISKTPSNIDNLTLHEPENNSLKTTSEPTIRLLNPDSISKSRQPPR